MLRYIPDNEYPSQTTSDSFYIVSYTMQFLWHSVYNLVWLCIEVNLNSHKTDRKKAPWGAFDEKKREKNTIIKIRMII